MSNVQNLNTAWDLAVTGLVLTWPVFTVRAAIGKLGGAGWTAFANLILFTIDCTLFLVFNHAYRETNHPNTSSGLSRYNLLFYIDTFFYVLAVVLTRIVLGALFLTKYPSGHGTRQLVHAALAVYGVSGIVYSLTLAVCGATNDWATPPGICSSSKSVRELAVFWTFLDTVSAFLMVVLPAKEIWIAARTRSRVITAACAVYGLFALCIAAASLIYLVRFILQGSGSQLSGYIQDKKYRLFEAIPSILLVLLAGFYPLLEGGRRPRRLGSMDSDSELALQGMVQHKYPKKDIRHWIHELEVRRSRLQML